MINPLLFIFFLLAALLSSHVLADGAVKRFTSTLRDLHEINRQMDALEWALCPYSGGQLRDCWQKHAIVLDSAIQQHQLHRLARGRAERQRMRAADQAFVRYRRINADLLIFGYVNGAGSGFGVASYRRQVIMNTFRLQWLQTRGTGLGCAKPAQLSCLRAGQARSVRALQRAETDAWRWMQRWRKLEWLSAMQRTTTPFWQRRTNQAFADYRQAECRPASLAVTAKLEQLRCEWTLNQARTEQIRQLDIIHLRHMLHDPT